jgi:hypothetical protein
MGYDDASPLLVKRLVTGPLGLGSPGDYEAQTVYAVSSIRLGINGVDCACKYLWLHHGVPNSFFKPSFNDISQVS